MRCPFTPEPPNCKSLRAGRSQLLPRLVRMASGDFVVPYGSTDAAVALFNRMPSLRVVQALSAGVDDPAHHISPGVILCNARGVHDASTAELAVSLTLASLRGTPGFVRLRLTKSGRQVFGPRSPNAPCCSWAMARLRSPSRNASWPSSATSCAWRAVPVLPQRHSSRILRTGRIAASRAGSDPHPSADGGDPGPRRRRLPRAHARRGTSGERLAWGSCGHRGPAPRAHDGPAPRSAACDRSRAPPTRTSPLARAQCLDQPARRRQQFQPSSPAPCACSTLNCCATRLVSSWRTS